MLVMMMMVMMRLNGDVDDHVDDDVVNDGDVDIGDV